MEQQTGRELSGAARVEPNPVNLAWPTPPEQIWGCLSPQQQRRVFQTVVWLCQELLRNRYRREREVGDEPV
jgi:hypothetical protein